MNAHPDREFIPLNVYAHPNSGLWEANQRWLADEANADLLRGQIAPGFTPDAQYDLAFFGGATVQNLIVSCFYVGPAGAWAPADMTAIDAALRAALLDANLNSVIAQYFSAPISAAVLPSQPLTTSLSVCQQSDVESLVSSAYTNGVLTGDFANTVFCMLLAPGIQLLDGQGDDSHNGLGGYHGSVSVATADGGQQTVYYAVGVYSQTANGVTNGIVAFDQPWKNVVATFYHEINEFRTDCNVEQATGNNVNGILGWYSPNYGEIGDIPMVEAGANLLEVMVEVPLADGSGAVPVQLMYSNRDHGPAAVSTP